MNNDDEAFSGQLDTIIFVLLIIILITKIEFILYTVYFLLTLINDKQVLKDSE
jgi:hypothetical protein